MKYRPCPNCDELGLELVKGSEFGTGDHYTCSKCYSSFIDIESGKEIFKSRTRRLRVMKGKK